MNVAFAKGSIAFGAVALKSAIHVSSFCPSLMDTSMVQNAMEIDPVLDPSITNVASSKRAAALNEVAGYIVFLCGPTSSYINGTALPTYGWRLDFASTTSLSKAGE